LDSQGDSESAITKIPSEKILMDEFRINFPPDIVQLKPKILEK